MSNDENTDLLLGLGLSLNGLKLEPTQEKLVWR